MNPTPWRLAKQRVSPSLPSVADVAIVGGGLSGLIAGLRLVEGGARVVLFESALALGQGAVGRGSGQIQWGLLEHPAQLASAIGDRDARELMQMSQRSIAGLDGFIKEFRCGGFWAASMDREDLGVQHSTQWMLQNGLDCKALDLDDLGRLLGTSRHPFSIGRLHSQEGACDPVELLDSIADLAIEKGLMLMQGHPVKTVDAGLESLAVFGETFRMDAELVVFAAGASVAKIEPWFLQKIFPVRAQHLWSAELADFKSTGRSQHGYVQWGPARQGGVVSGCRWASDHLEVGESRHGLNSRVSERLLEFSKKIGLEEENSRMEWSSVMGFSCDALPIVGPLPGQPRKIACGGYNGQDLGLAVACATQVANGILGESAPPIPQRFRASRFL